MEKAYPNVITSRLNGELMEMGWETASIDVWKKLQDQCEYAVRWKGEQSDGYAQEKGLKAGCPTSCRLYLLFHMSALEQWRGVRRAENAQDGRGSCTVPRVSTDGDFLFLENMREKRDNGRLVDYALANRHSYTIRPR